MIKKARVGWVWVTCFFLTTAVFALPLRHTLELSFIGQDSIDWVLSCDLRTAQGWQRVFFEPHFLFVYRPVTALSFGLDRLLFGLDAKAYHGTDLTFHVLAGIAVFLLANKLLRSPIAGSVAASLIAIHPSVTRILSNIDARAEPLVALFSTLAILETISESPRRKLHAWLAAFAFLLAFGSKEIGITAIVPMAVALLYPGESSRRAPWSRRFRLIVPTIGLLLFLLVIRYLILGTVSGDPEPSLSRRLGTLLDSLPLLLFPSLALPASWVENALNVPAHAAHWIALAFFTASLLGLVVSVVLVVRLGTTYEKRALLVGASWLAAQYAIYVWTGYYAPRHAYSAMFSVSVLLAATLNASFRLFKSHPQLAFISLPAVTPFALLWVLTGPLTSSLGGALSASRLQRNFLAQLEQMAEEKSLPPVVLVLNYPGFTRSEEDLPRFSFAYPSLFSEPLGHAALPMEGATKLLHESHPSWRGEVRALMVGFTDAHLSRVPLTLERKEDRLRVHFGACKAYFNPSKTMTFVASVGERDELLIRKTRLGGKSHTASLFIFDGEKGFLEPFPDLLEIELDPSVRSELYPVKGKFGVPLKED